MFANSHYSPVGEHYRNAKTHISTQPPAPQQDPRIPLADEDHQRQGRVVTPPCQGTQARLSKTRFQRLKQQHELRQIIVEKRLPARILLAVRIVNYLHLSVSGSAPRIKAFMLHPGAPSTKIQANDRDREIDRNRPLRRTSRRRRHTTHVQARRQRVPQICAVAQAC